MTEKVYIEFIRSVPGQPYGPGDRTLRTKAQAESLIDDGVARKVPEAEQEARQYASKASSTGKLDHLVEFKMADGKYKKGDKTWVDEKTAKSMERARVARTIEVRHEAAKKAIKGGEDAAEAAAEERESRRERLPDDYRGRLLPAAKAVAERRGVDFDDEVENQQKETLQDYLLDHWHEYLAVAAAYEDSADDES